MRCFEQEDQSGIIGLWAAVYPEIERNRWLSRWRWLYEGNPAGLGKIWIAEHEGRIVGQYSLIPIRLALHGRIATAFLRADVMTHPLYRHRGIAMTLARRAIEEANKSSSITIGFPSSGANEIIRKLGGVQVGALKILIRPLNWKKAIDMKVKNQVLSKWLAIVAEPVFNRTLLPKSEPPAVEGLDVKESSSFDQRVDGLSETVLGQRVAIVRDGKYLNWRYRSPGQNYSLLIAERAGSVLGYLVQKQETSRDANAMEIFDIVAESEEVMHHLVSKAVEISQSKDADVIIYHLIGDGRYRRVFAKAGFFHAPFENERPFCITVAGQTGLERFLRDSSNWILQLGDSDVL